jgi:hypothetical protein
LRAKENKSFSISLLLLKSAYTNLRRQRADFFILCAAKDWVLVGEAGASGFFPFRRATFPHEAESTM